LKLKTFKIGTVSTKFAIPSSGKNRMTSRGFFPEEGIANFVETVPILKVFSFKGCQ
jgi:hypothetical protein